MGKKITLIYKELLQISKRNNNNLIEYRQVIKMEIQWLLKYWKGTQFCLKKNFELKLPWDTIFNPSKVKILTVLSRGKEEKALSYIAKLESKLIKP